MNFLKPETLQFKFYDIVKSENDSKYEFHFVQSNDKFVNFKLSKSDIYKINFDKKKEYEMYIKLNKNSPLVKKLIEIDNYMSKLENFVEYRYVPILRKNEQDYPYIKAKLLVDFTTHESLTNLTVIDFYSNEQRESKIDSIDHFKEICKDIKGLVIFPNKLYVSDGCYGVTLRIKNVIKE